MARENTLHAWRPIRTGALVHARDMAVMFAFNICLLALPLAGVSAAVLIQREGLFSFNDTPAIETTVRSRIERLAGELIQLDFDRRRQWDDLVAMEVADRDPAAARGFLLSAPHMLSPNDAQKMLRPLGADPQDAAIETAALQQLTPGTRDRYQSLVPLLGNRSATGARRPDQSGDIVVGDQRDFELLSAAMLSDPEADQLQFTLTGLSLGLGGDMSPRVRAGAAVLVSAARAPDFPLHVRDELAGVLAGVLPLDAFRALAAQNSTRGLSPSAFAQSGAAFRAALNASRLPPLYSFLDELGGASDAVGPAGAIVLLTHAQSMADAARLRQIAEAGGDRAVAVAKRMQRDGELLRAAQGTLRFTRSLILTFAVLALSLIGLALAAGATAWQGFFADFLKFPRSDKNHELIRDFETPWRML